MGLAGGARLLHGQRHRGRPHVQVGEVIRTKDFFGFTFMFSFGVFLPKFKEHFQVGSAEISTVNAIQMGACFAAGRNTTDDVQYTWCTGPLASLLTNMLGWRLTTVLGSLVAGAVGSQYYGGLSFFTGLTAGTGSQCGGSLSLFPLPHSRGNDR